MFYDLINLRSTIHFPSGDRLAEEGSFFLLVLLIVVVVLGLVQLPLLLSLDGHWERAVLVPLPIVAHGDLPPEVVHAHGAQNNVSVVQLVVVAHPGSDESPESLDRWVGAESGSLLRPPL